MVVVICELLHGTANAKNYLKIDRSGGVPVYVAALQRTAW
jgi:hypothetical protein